MHQVGSPNWECELEQNKLGPTLAKICLTGSLVPCGKSRIANHITPECLVETNKCIQCGSSKHLIVVGF